jgi:hypothetical protein
VHFTGANSDQLFGHLDIPLGNASQPWVVGIYSSCGPVQFTVKSWCSGVTTIILNCCVIVEDCVLPFQVN